MPIGMDSINWSIYNGALVPDVPPHTEIKLSGEQAKVLLKKSSAYFLRWPSDFDCGRETEWWYLIRDKSIDLSEFNSKTRAEIRKGLEHCTVKKVDAECIAKNGYEVYISAVSTYGKSVKPPAQEEFTDRMMSRKEDPIFDFWAAFDKSDGKMIAYFMNRLDAECCQYSMGKFHPEFLKLNAHHALVYEMTNYYLDQSGLKYVSAGARSISHKTHVQDFLISKLHFRKAFCRLNVVYSPLIRVLVNILYPFRSMISKIDTKVTNKINVLLRQEMIRRSFAD